MNFRPWHEALHQDLIKARNDLFWVKAAQLTVVAVAFWFFLAVFNYFSGYWLYDNPWVTLGLGALALIPLLLAQRRISLPPPKTLWALRHPATLRGVAFPRVLAVYRLLFDLKLETTISSKRFEVLRGFSIIFGRISPWILIFLSVLFLMVLTASIVIAAVWAVELLLIQLPGPWNSSIAGQGDPSRTNLLFLAAGASSTVLVTWIWQSVFPRLLYDRQGHTVRRLPAQRQTQLIDAELRLRSSLNKLGVATRRLLKVIHTYRVGLYLDWLEHLDKHGGTPPTSFAQGSDIVPLLNDRVSGSMSIGQQFLQSVEDFRNAWQTLDPTVRDLLIIRWKWPGGYLWWEAKIEDRLSQVDWIHTFELQREPEHANSLMEDVAEFYFDLVRIDTAVSRDLDYLDRNPSGFEPTGEASQLK